MLFGSSHSERPKALGSRIYIICAGGGVRGEAGWFGELNRNKQTKPKNPKMEEGLKNMNPKSSYTNDSLFDLG